MMYRNATCNAQQQWYPQHSRCSSCTRMQRVMNSNNGILIIHVNHVNDNVTNLNVVIANVDPIWTMFTDRLHLRLTSTIGQYLRIGCNYVWRAPLDNTFRSFALTLKPCQAGEHPGITCLLLSQTSWLRYCLKLPEQAFHNLQCHTFALQCHTFAHTILLELRRRRASG